MLRICITNETHKREEVRITVVVLVEVVDIVVIGNSYLTLSFMHSIKIVQ